MRKSMIVAMTPQRVIGRNGELPWRLSADLKRFKQLTMSHHIIMGRKTFDSIGGLLPGRAMVVVTRQQHLVIPGVQVVNQLSAALDCCLDDPEVFFIGGQQIYADALPQCDRIYRTLVHAQVHGDTFFPEIPDNQWELDQEEHHKSDPRNEFDFTFQVIRRIRSASS